MLFIDAAKDGELPVVKLFLHTRNVEQSVKDIALVGIFSSASLEVAKVLLDEGADVTAHKNKAIIDASECCCCCTPCPCLEKVKLFLSRGADPRVNPAANDNIAIRVASTWGKTNVVKVLLEDPRVDPAAKNNDAIESARRSGRVETVRLLLTVPRVIETYTREIPKWMR